MSNVKNYTEPGGEKTVIGGTLEIAEGGQLIGLPMETSRMVTTLINDTGAPSVKGSAVALSDMDHAFKLLSQENNSIGVVLDEGIPDGQPCRVVTGGSAQVLLKDGTGSTAGYWVKGSATPGRCETAEHPTGAAFTGITEHFKEMGHCRENKAPGTNVLCWVELHFN